MNKQPFQRPDRLSRDTSISSDTSTVSTADSEAPFLPYSIQPPARASAPRWMVALVIASVLLSAGSVCVCILQYTGAVQPRTTTQPLCFPCHSLVTTPFPDQDVDIHSLERHFLNNTMICCASKPQQLSLMVDKLVKRRLAESEVKAAEQTDLVAWKEKEKEDEIPARAFLLFGARNQATSSQVSDWISDQPPAYLEGFVLSHGRLVTQHSGLYLIYSQMYFKVNQAESATAPSLLGHKVHRYSMTIPNGGTEDLLQSAHTCCHQDAGQDQPYIHTSYIAGVFMLNSRDEIYVTVCNTSYIYRHAVRSYLGVIRLV